MKLFKKRLTDEQTWFQQARFGMFVHWGLYSLLEHGEWVKHDERITNEEYRLLADRFTSQRFDPEAWVDLAKRSGMKYMVLTTKHCDGFCLFDSQASDFTSVKTAARRDFVAEYVKACRKAGLKVGLYYALGDWQFGYPAVRESKVGAAAMLRQAHAQTRELMSNYGKIDLLWFDAGFCYPSLPNDGPKEQITFWQSKKLLAMVKRLQPHILVNDRTGLPADFSTPEGHVIASPPGRAWEVCMTIGSPTAWGYVPHDPVLKTEAQLIDYMAQAFSKEGNFLLNVGPKADGSVSAEFKRRLKRIGRWTKENAEAIYGSRRYPKMIARAVGYPLACGSHVYIYVIRWPGKELVIGFSPAKVSKAVIVKTGKRLSVENKPDQRVVLRGLPALPPDSCCTVIRLTMAK